MTNIWSYKLTIKTVPLPPEKPYGADRITPSNLCQRRASFLDMPVKHPASSCVISDILVTQGETGFHPRS